MMGRVATVVYAVLARVLLPAHFRRAYLRAMVEAFGDTLQDMPAGRMRFVWIAREFGLLLVAAVTSRRQPLTRGRRGGRDAGRLSGVARDLRYGGRALRRQPAFTFFAVTTLALGIGCNTAIFSIVRNVLLEPPPFPEPHRIVGVFESSERMEYGVTSPANYRRWSAESEIFSAISAIRGVQFHLNSQGTPERLFGRAVEPGFFAAMGVEPLLGRPLVEGDDVTGVPVVVLGHALWERQFGLDSNAVGRSITLNGETHTVVGVMPSGFQYPAGTDLWVPLVMEPGLWEQNDWYFLGTVARLADNVTLHQAQARMDVVAAELREARSRSGVEAVPESLRGRGIRLEPIHSVEVRRVRSHLWMLYGAVGLVLLIACTNVANLLLSRAVVRTREIALRTALGASRPQVLRQLLVESVLLGTIGGVAGVALATIGLQLFTTMWPEWFPRVDRLTIDGMVLVYTLIISIGTGMLFGIAPALRLSRVATSDALRDAGVGPSVRGFRLGQLLVVLETALALVLLLGAGLLARSFHRLTTQPLGFDPSNLLTVEIPLPRHAYPEDSQQAAFFVELVERAGTLPGVTSAAATNNLPFGLGWYGTSFTLERGNGETTDASAASHRVSPGYFETLRLPVVLGRTFQSLDRESSVPTAIVNQEFVDQFLPATDPLDGTIRPVNREDAHQIVGVVANAKHLGLDDDAEPAVYFPMAQRPAPTMMVFVRAATDPLPLASMLVDQVRDLDASLPVTRVSTMNQFVSNSLSQPRFYTVLLSVFAASALVLACVGVYGLLSFLVAQRTSEIGIRMALGAREGTVLRLVIGRGLALALPGVAIGLFGAYVSTGLLANLLYQITPTDPATFAGVSVVFVLLAVCASYFPARRGTRIDPIRALRAE